MTQLSLWNAAEIAATTQGAYGGTAGKPAETVQVTGISIDTRTLAEGDLFVPLRGPNFDGHDFIDDAVARGAALVLCEKGEAPATVRVADTLLALQDLASGARARTRAAIMAVTGSVGKTTVKSMLHTAFSAAGTTHANDASLNNHWGVPLSLARLPEQARYGVFEIGMNHAGEITPLSRLVAPHLAIITTVAAAHIAHFDSVEAIARAKAEIFQGMDANGIAVLPRDCAQYPLLLAEARTQGLRRILTFGEHPESMVRLLSSTETPQGHQVTMCLQGADRTPQEISFTLGLSGKHHALNALAVIAALEAFDVLNDVTLGAFATMSPVSGRGNRISCHVQPDQPPLVLIDETHNASPVAVEAALRGFKNIQAHGKRYIVLGDMLELGPQSEALHRSLASAVLAARPDHVLLSGALMRALSNELERTAPQLALDHYPDSKALAEALVTKAAAGDVVLVKGSHGARMKTVIDALCGLCHDCSTGKPPTITRKTG